MFGTDFFIKMIINISEPLTLDHLYKH